MPPSAKRPKSLSFWYGFTLLVVLPIVAFVMLRMRHQQQLFAERVEQMQQRFDEDRPEGYRRVLELARAISDDTPGAAEVEARAAYAAAILSLEYHLPNHGKEARQWLALLARSPQEGRQSDHSASMVRCAESLMVWADGDLEQARAELGQLKHEGMQGPYPALEALRLTLATHGSEGEVQAAMTRLEGLLDKEARGWVYLGLISVGRNDLARAQRAFNRARAASPNHTGARMGQLWLALGDNRPDHDHQEVASVAHEVDTVLADEALSGPERAMALVVRARARQLEGESNNAQRDVAEAQHICPGHPFLELPDVLPRPAAVPTSPLRASGQQQIKP